MGWKIDLTAMLADVVSPIPFTGDAVQFRAARTYVASLPIGKKQKEAILAEIPKPGWFS